ncbi:MAG: hypothetical protein B6D53_03660 [Candidatus Omnitrophica bacterium 4484_49]|nr:MAG: hypothetical protein B6D53_03660 [Candidatus Omnitrophica bacterium 4484_49]
MRLFRWLFKKLILVVIILGVIFYFLQDQIMKFALPYIIAKNSNVKVRIAKVDSELQKGYIRLAGIVVLNPQGFKQEKLAEINSVVIDLNLKRLLLNKIHFSKLFVDIATIYIVKGENGMVNISRIKKPGTESKKEKRRRQISIDKMHIRVGEVIYVDYSQKPARAKRIRLNLDKEFTDVTDLRKTLIPLFTQIAVNKTLYGIKEKLRLPDFKIF